MHAHSPFRWMLPLLLAAGAPASAATTAVHLTVLDRSFVWQNGDLDPITGEAVDAEAYRTFDIDSDGRHDVGFLGGPYPEIALMMNTGVEVLMYSTVAGGSRGGVLARNEMGALLGADTARGQWNWWRGSPSGFSVEEWNEEFWGDVWPRIEGLPFPNSVLATGFFNHPPMRWKGLSGYVGLRLLKDDGWHYAWVYVEKDADLPFVGGTVLSYAYETQPGVPILAIPEPGPGVLALVCTVALLGMRGRAQCGAGRETL